MRSFRLLRADEIECRISEVAKTGKYLRLLLYKTARTDAALLDETYGLTGWQNDYKVIDGKMYCGIGIKDKESGEWIWKWNVGTESNTEAEKGQASDALKRAGFVFGLGTELYSAPDITVWSDKCTIKDYNGKIKCYDRFTVKNIEYDAQENISALTIVNDTTGAECFTWRKDPGQAPPVQSKPRSQQRPAPTPATESKPPETAAPGKKVCSVCGKAISEKVYSFSTGKFGLPLCMDCQKNHKTA